MQSGPGAEVFHPDLAFSTSLSLTGSTIPPQSNQPEDLLHAHKNQTPNWTALEEHLTKLIDLIPSNKQKDASQLLLTIKGRVVSDITEQLTLIVYKWTPPRHSKRAKKSNQQPKQYNAKIGPRSKRSALYKKTQDLFTKKRSIAEKKLPGKDLDTANDEPPIDQVENFYRKLYENPSNVP